MPKQQLTNKEKRKIVKMVVDDGMPVASVAYEFGRSRGAVYGIVARATVRDTVQRKVKLDKHMKRHIRRMIKEDPSISVAALCANPDLCVSHATVERYLKKRGYVCEGTRIPTRGLNK